MSAGEARLALDALERAVAEFQALYKRGIPLSVSDRKRRDTLIAQLTPRGAPRTADHYRPDKEILALAWFLDAESGGASAVEARKIVATKLRLPDDAEGKTDETVEQIIKRAKRRIKSNLLR